jgi:hypothetical protein
MKDVLGVGVFNSDGMSVDPVQFRIKAHTGNKRRNVEVRQSD